MEKKKEVKIQKKVWKPKAIPEKMNKDNDILENQESRLQIDPMLTSPVQSKEKMEDPTNQLVIYQNNDLEWED